jgi:hypothetical protein
MDVGNAGVAGAFTCRDPSLAVRAANPIPSIFRKPGLRIGPDIFVGALTTIF